MKKNIELILRIILIWILIVASICIIIGMKDIYISFDKVARQYENHPCKNQFLFHSFHEVAIRRGAEVVLLAIETGRQIKAIIPIFTEKLRKFLKDE